MMKELLGKVGGTSGGKGGSMHIAAMQKGMMGHFLFNIQIHRMFNFWMIVIHIP